MSSKRRVGRTRPLGTGLRNVGFLIGIGAGVGIIEGSDVGRNVDRMLTKYLERHYLDSAFVGAGKYNRCGRAVHMSA